MFLVSGVGGAHNFKGDKDTENSSDYRGKKRVNKKEKTRRDKATP